MHTARGYLVSFGAALKSGQNRQQLKPQTTQIQCIWQVSPKEERCSADRIQGTCRQTKPVDKWIDF